MGRCHLDPGRHLHHIQHADRYTKNYLLRCYCTAIVLFLQFFEGFGMLESGIVSTKNEVNIMMKNVVDVVLGGLTYWIFGYGVSYGGDGPSWFVDSDDADDWTDSGMGATHATFLFQLSFATTIVSGAMAERSVLSI